MLTSEDLETRLYMLEALTMALAATHPDPEALVRQFDIAAGRIAAFLEGNGAEPARLQRLRNNIQRIRMQIEPE